MKSSNNKIVMSVLFTAGLILLSGCSWWPFGKKAAQGSSAASGDVLLTIDGTPAMTVQDYEEQLDMARKANPQIDMLLQMMPNAEREFVFRGMTTAKLMQAWAKKQGIDQTPEFQKQRKQLHEAMDLQLFMKYFDDAHPVNVSDSDLENYYEEKKDVIPALTITPGGVEIFFVRFDSKDKADKFYDKTREIKKSEAFKSIAEDQKQQVGTSVINEKSPFSEAIKKTVLDLKKIPSVHVVKAGENAYWVILAAGKSEAKYRDLKNPEVQNGLKKMLADERKEKQLEKLVEDLKKEMNVVENNKYFEDKEQQKRAAMASQNDENKEESEEQVEMPVKV